MNGTWRFGLFQRNILRHNVTAWTSEKVVLFFPGRMFQREICVPFVKSHLDTSIRPSQSFFGKGNWFVECCKRDSVTKFTSLKFCLPFAQTVNQLVCAVSNLCVLLQVVSVSFALTTRWINNFLVLEFTSFESYC